MIKMTGLDEDWTVRTDPVAASEAPPSLPFTVGLEVRGVFARTWVIGLAGELGFGQTGGCSVSFSGRTCTPLRSWIWLHTDLFGALRIEVLRIRAYALAAEVGLGPSLGTLVDRATLGGAHAQLRIVFQIWQWMLTLGARSRLMASTEPGVQLEASLAAVFTVGLAF